MKSEQPVYRYLIKSGLFLFFLLILVSARSQSYFSRTYTEAEGLSSSMVYSVAQDGNGLMWFATRTGISSYNGLTFRNYGIKDGLSNLSYSFLIYDEKKQLWALPSDGKLIPAKFNGMKWEATQPYMHENDFFNFTAFEIFYQNNKPVIACGTQNDGLFLNIEGKWVHLTTAEGLPANMVNGLCYQNQNLLVGTSNGLAIYRNSRIEIFHDPLIENHTIEAIKNDWLSGNDYSSRTYVLSNNWMGYIEGEKVTVLANNFLIPHFGNNGKSFLYIDPVYGIYFGNPFVVYNYEYTTRKVQMIDRTNGLITEGGTEAFTDREKNIWFTSFRGITKIPGKRWASFNSDNGLSNDEVASAIEWSPGKYVFGHFGKLTIMENGAFSSLDLRSRSKKNLNDTRILDMAVDPEGNLWAAVSRLGLAKISKNKTITWIDNDFFHDASTTSIVFCNDGTCYVATHSKLLRFDHGKFIPVNININKVTGLRKIFKGPDNDLYISTVASGIIHYKNGITTQYLNPLDRNTNSTYSFFVDSKKRKWVGSANGLYLIKNNVLVKPEDKNLMITSSVFTIMEDKNNNLWLGTDNGIYRWDGISMDHFSVTNGLAGQEINLSAAFIDKQGHLWFGTNNGISEFQPEFDVNKKDIPPPIIRLLCLKAGKDSLGLNHEIVLNSDKTNLSFLVSIVSLLDESRVYYKYNLEGLDKEFSEEILYRSEEITFHNLKPGQYRFCIKARNASGTWSTPIFSEKIRIKPPFYQEWWFLGIVLLVLGFFGFLGGRFILVSKYNRKLEKTVKERTEALILSEKNLLESNAAKDKFFSIISHDLRSPFNTILGFLEILTSDQHPLTPTERKRILNNLKVTANQTFNLLENLLTWARAQKGIIPFQPELFDLSKEIQDPQSLPGLAAEEKKILLSFNVEPNLIVYADRNMVHTITRNLLSNAIKFTAPGGNIYVRAKMEDGMVHVSVKDTGKGMEPEILNRLFKIDDRVITKDTNNERGTGLGLILCKDFTEKNNGKIGVESAPGRGSTFWFTLPTSSGKLPG